MWLIISLLLILLLSLEGVVSTFFIIIMLNGYSSLPDALVNLYLASAVVMLLSLGFGAGFVAHKWAALRPISLWASGSLSGFVALVLYPPLLIALTFGLLAMFGML
jgi:hypothetical protein